MANFELEGYQVHAIHRKDDSGTSISNTPKDQGGSRHLSQLLIKCAAFLASARCESKKDTKTVTHWTKRKRYFTSVF
ncbi:hypothetical protein EVAR_57726_1 [Eumeta japonica]|uniref:Uncharacterized protein n=1 Tax=Eumeta variegata TaxID=151549 RepID=A0A4C1Y907_EUMVA|nr:hypothetical protein EVAR_57726_1 [Eumeta japonica]